MRSKITACLLIAVGSLSAQHNFITINTMTVGPNTVYKEIIETTEPWIIYVLESDVTDPDIIIETMKANDVKPTTEKLSSMVFRNQSELHQVVCAINGDYFDATTGTTNSQVIRGELIKEENFSATNPIYWSTVGFDENNRPCINTNVLSMKLFTKSNTIQIDEINMGRGSQEVVLYNSYYGSSTGTDTNGVEYILASVDGEWFVNDTINCVVQSKNRNKTPLSSGSAVISASVLDSLLLTENLQAGDTVQLLIHLSGQLPRLKELVGGFPMIVKNGINYALDGYREEGGGSTFATDRHPRTAVGFSADSSKLYFVVVDGRQDFSVGMSLPELADFMIDQGVAYGINLDGGGSSEMIVRNNVVNSPSDGGERSVGNALMVISTASTGELSSIQVSPDYCRLFKGEHVALNVSGWDDNFNQLSIDESQVTYTVPDDFGSIVDGKFISETWQDSGYVLVHYQEFSDSIYVYQQHITDVSIYPKEATTDTSHIIDFSITLYDNDGDKHGLSFVNALVTITNPSVGKLDCNGVFKGLSIGSTQIIVEYEGYSDTAEVTIEVFEGVHLLDNMDSMDDWTLSGIMLDATGNQLSVVSEPKTEGGGAFRIDYCFTRVTESSWIYLNTNKELGGFPKSVTLDFLSDGAGHRCFLAVTDNSGAEYNIAVPGRLKDTTAYVHGVMTTENDAFSYPLTINAIAIMLGTSAALDSVNSGTIYIDNLQVDYTDESGLPDRERTSLLHDFHLYQNYPNPFNPTTAISYDLPNSSDVTLQIYDITGRLVETLVNQHQNAENYQVQWNASGYSSGVYFYRIQAGNFIQVRKMLLLK